MIEELFHHTQADGVFLGRREVKGFPVLYNIIQETWIWHVGTMSKAGGAYFHLGVGKCSASNYTD